MTLLSQTSKLHRKVYKYVDKSEKQGGLFTVTITHVQNSMPTEALLYSMEVSPTVVCPSPSPSLNVKMKCHSASSKRLCFTYMRTINCFCTCSLLSVNLPRRTSSCLREALPRVSVVGQRSGGCTGRPRESSHLVTAHSVGQPCAHQPIQGSGQSRR